MSAFTLFRTLAVALLLGLTACESDLSNEVFTADEAFLNAVPRRAMLRLATDPEVTAADADSAALETAAQALGPSTAELYRMTRDVTWSLDHQILGTLRAVEEITARPPTTRTDDTRTWGPFREALSPYEVRFVMARGADAEITYAFEQRVVGGDAGTGDFQAAVSGGWAPTDGVFGEGEIDFDLGVFGGQGHVTTIFERHAGGVDFTMELERFADGADGLANARYVAHRGQDGGGELAFVYLRDDGQRWDLKSRWLADGAGRADARITAAGGGAGVVTECWDTDFDRVYASGDVESGDAGDCVFAERSLPEADSVR